MKECLKPEDAGTGRILAVRIDTTGTSLDRDEILRVCVLDAGGGDESPKPLFDSVFKPTRHESWPGAERRNGISPARTAHAPFFAEKLDELNALLATADGFAFYNAEFDITFLRAQGAVFPRNAAVFDVMRDWSFRRAGVKDEDRDVPWASARDLAHGLGLREPGPGLEERTGFLRCAFRILAVQRAVKPRPFAGGSPKLRNLDALAAAMGGHAAPVQAAPAGGPGSQAAPSSAPAEARRPLSAPPAGDPIPEAEIRALRKRLEGSVPEDLDGLLGRPSPGYFTDPQGRRHMLASPMTRLMGCEEMSYEEAVRWLLEREEAIASARDARMAQAAQAKAQGPAPGAARQDSPSMPEAQDAVPAAEAGDFCARCREFFNAAAAERFVLPGGARLAFAARMLEDGRAAFRAGIADPGGMLYAEGQEPACAGVYKPKRGGSHVDPRAAAMLFAEKLEKSGMLPPGLGAFCAETLRGAVKMAEAPAPAAPADKSAADPRCA